MWRRGANLEGDTANFIETEQLLEIGEFRFSFLQVLLYINEYQFPVIPFSSFFSQLVIFSTSIYYPCFQEFALLSNMLKDFECCSFPMIQISMSKLLS